jgi:uncharacterized protein
MKTKLWICVTIGAAMILTGVLLLALVLMNPIAVFQSRATQYVPRAARSIRATVPIIAQPEPSLSRSITVIGEGSVKIKPDIARANIGVETTGATVKEATASAASTMQAVLAAFKAQGIAEGDVQTSGYSVWADRSAGPEGRPAEKPTYRVSNTVSVAIRDLSKVGVVLDADIEAGANSIQGINFGVDEPKKLTSEARAQATDDALARASDLARLHGVELGTVLSVSEVIGGGNGYAARNLNVLEAPSVAALGGGSGPFNPGEMELRLQLQVVYSIR